MVAVLGSLVSVSSAVAPFSGNATYNPVLALVVTIHLRASVSVVSVALWDPGNRTKAAGTVIHQVSVDD